MPVLSGVSGNALASLLSLTTFGFWGDDNGEIPFDQLAWTVSAEEGAIVADTGSPRVCDKVNGCTGGSLTFAAPDLASDGEALVYAAGALGFSEVSGLGTEVYDAFSGGATPRLAALLGASPGTVCGHVGELANRVIVSPRDAQSGLHLGIDVDDTVAVRAVATNGAAPLGSADTVVACGAWNGTALTHGAVFAYRGLGRGRVTGSAVAFSLAE